MVFFYDFKRNMPLKTSWNSILFMSYRIWRWLTLMLATYNFKMSSFFMLVYKKAQFRMWINGFFPINFVITPFLMVDLFNWLLCKLKMNDFIFSWFSKSINNVFRCSIMASWCFTLINTNFCCLYANHYESGCAYIYIYLSGFQ